MTVTYAKHGPEVAKVKEQTVLILTDTDGDTLILERRLNADDSNAETHFFTNESNGDQVAVYLDEAGAEALYIALKLEFDL